MKTLRSFIPSLAVDADGGLRRRRRAGRADRHAARSASSRSRWAATSRAASASGRPTSISGRRTRRTRGPSFEIELASIDLASEETEAEIRRPAWFDTAKFPVATFASTRGARTWAAIATRSPATLSIKGIDARRRRPGRAAQGRRRQQRRRGPVHAQAPRLQDRRGHVGRHRRRRRRRRRPHPDGAAARAVIAGMVACESPATCACLQAAARCSAGVTSVPRRTHSRCRSSDRGASRMRLRVSRGVAFAPMPRAPVVPDRPGATIAGFAVDHFGILREHGHFERPSGTIVRRSRRRRGRQHRPRHRPRVGRHRLGSARRLPPRADDVRRRALSRRSASARRHLEYRDRHVVAVDGDITLHGVTRPVRLEVQRLECGRMAGDGREAASASGDRAHLAAATSAWTSPIRWSATRSSSISTIAAVRIGDDAEARRAVSPARASARDAPSSSAPPPRPARA